MASENLTLMNEYSTDKLDINKVLQEGYADVIEEGEVKLLKRRIREYAKSLPLQGKSVILNCHLTHITLTLTEALLATGASVVVTSTSGLQQKPEVLKVLQSVHLYLSPEAVCGNNYDVAIDCHGELRSLSFKQRPATFIELTKVHDVVYSTNDLNGNVDECEIKKLETHFGTGNGVVRSIIENLHRTVKSVVVMKFPKESTANGKRSGRTSPLSESLTSSYETVAHKVLDLIRVAMSEEKIAEDIAKKVTFYTRYKNGDWYYIYECPIEVSTDAIKRELNRSFALSNFNQQDVEHLKKLVQEPMPKGNELQEQLIQTIQTISLENRGWVNVKFEKEDVNSLKAFLDAKGKKDLSAKLLLKSDLSSFTFTPVLVGLPMANDGDIKNYMKDYYQFVQFGYGKVGRGIVFGWLGIEVPIDNIIVVDTELAAIRRAALDGFICESYYHNNGKPAYIASWFRLEPDDILQQITAANCIVTATGHNDIMTEYYQFNQNDFPCTCLANAGTGNEYGVGFNKILADGRPVNFALLTLPTLPKFLDPVFSSLVEMAIWVVENPETAKKQQEETKAKLIITKRESQIADFKIKIKWQEEELLKLTIDRRNLSMQQKAKITKLLRKTIQADQKELTLLEIKKLRIADEEIAGYYVLPIENQVNLIKEWMSSYGLNSSSQRAQVMGLLSAESYKHFQPRRNSADVQVIYPSDFNGFVAQCKGWKDQHKRGDVLFIFNPSKKGWEANLLRNDQKELVQKDIEAMSAFGRELSKLNSENILSYDKHTLQGLLQSNTLFENNGSSQDPSSTIPGSDDISLKSNGANKNSLNGYKEHGSFRASCDVSSNGYDEQVSNHLAKTQSRVPLRRTTSENAQGISLANSDMFKSRLDQRNPDQLNDQVSNTLMTS